MSGSPLKVIVVGAGLAGLAIAHGLQENNISYIIVDRETTPRDRNWGITLSWALPLLEKLLPKHLYDNLQVCQPDPGLDAIVAGKKGVLIRDGASGEPKTQAHFPVIRRLQIQKTKKALSKGLNIQYGKRLTDVSIATAGPTAHFDDGTSETGSVIIGADGGASQVRRWLLGPAAAQEVLPFEFMNFPFSLPAEKALWLDGVMNPNVDVATHPKSMYIGLFLLDKPDMARPETWVFYFLVTWPIAADEDEENRGSRLQQLRARMGGWADPYKSVVNWLPDDTVIGPDQLRIWHPKPWDNRHGMVTLAGDAAHRQDISHTNGRFAEAVRLMQMHRSMTFHRGQGGNLAIKDAAEFVTRMAAVTSGETSLQDAVTDYDVGVVDRGQEVEISKAQAFAFHDYANIENSPVFKMGIKPAGT